MLKHLHYIKKQKKNSASYNINSITPLLYISTKQNVYNALQKYSSPLVFFHL